MKGLNKRIGIAATGVALCMFLAFPVIAQHSSSSGNGGGGGGSHASSGGGGGGGGHVSVSGGGGSAARPSGGASFGRSSGSSGTFRGSGAGVAHSSGVVGIRGGAPNGQRPTYVYHNGAISRSPAVVQNVGVRGAAPRRVGVVSAVTYRSAPQIGYGHPTHAGYWGTHGYYHFNHGGYNTGYATRLGYHCRHLRGGYSFFWADMNYFFLDGFFYTYDDDEYTVVEPPVGAEVTSICDSAQSIVINGQQYYECQGVYYQQVTKDDGSVVYMVAGKDGVLNTDQQVQDDAPPALHIGDIVTKLPDNCRKIKLNGEVIYVSPDGVYYKEIIDANGNKTYKIVGLPDDTETPDQGTN